MGGSRGAGKRMDVHVCTVDGEWYIVISACTLAIASLHESPFPSSPCLPPSLPLSLPHFLIYICSCILNACVYQSQHSPLNCPLHSCILCVDDGMGGGMLNFFCTQRGGVGATCSLGLVDEGLAEGFHELKDKYCDHCIHSLPPAYSNHSEQVICNVHVRYTI